MELSGPGIKREEIRIEDSSDRISFRTILFYEIALDSLSLRFDVKSGEHQHGTSVNIQESVSLPGAPYRRDDPLIEPKGVLKAMAVIADRSELIRALRELADALEQTKVEKSHV